VLTWRDNPAWTIQQRAKYLGKPAGYRSHGYVIVMVDGKNYRAHQLAWLLSFGAWPEGSLDHINCNRADNRLVNIRQATPSQNGHNRCAPRNNTSGMKGASFSKSNKAWQAQIGFRGVKTHLGFFETPEDAHQAYCRAAERMHGVFARTS